MVGWQRKAAVMRVCSYLPWGTALYRLLQKTLGRLKPQPMSRLPLHAEMVRWLVDHGTPVEGRRFFEVGTGQIPIVPIGFFLCGAESVLTVDIARSVDFGLTQGVLQWITEHRQSVATLYYGLVALPVLTERLDLVEELRNEPDAFLERAGIRYLAPANAANTGLPDRSIDCQFSVTVLEHVRPELIGGILSEGERVLAPGGVAVHFIDLSDHFQHQDSSISKINFLRFSEKEWHHIAGNGFAYCNRLRASDYMSYFQRSSLRIVRREAVVDDESVRVLNAGFPLNDRYSDYRPEDICTTSLRVMLARGGGAEA